MVCDVTRFIGARFTGTHASTPTIAWHIRIVTPTARQELTKKMVVCSVQGCKSKSSGGEVGNELRYFRFPTDKIVCNSWVEKCGRKSPINTATARVCSLHFVENDYLLKHRLLKYSPKKKQLVKGAIPSVNLSDTILTTPTKKTNIGIATIPTRKRHQENIKAMFHCSKQKNGQNCYLI